jgi:gamma-glutamyltranspeptidase / glutathione hydrolase
MRKFFLFPVFFFLVICSCNKTKSSSGITEGLSVTSKNGMVVSAHRESSRIGVEILRKGGNAIDAAVATELALAVCYPEAGNIGGGGFMVIRTADGKVDAIDFREKAPIKASRDMYLDKEGNVIEGLSLNTHLAAGVPGTVDGIIEAHAKYGRLPFKDLIQPSIDLAEKGFPIPENQSYSLNRAKSEFIKRNLKWPAFVKDSLWKTGDILVQPELAATLKLIRDYGREGFYAGKTARLIVKEMDRANGIITLQDLKEYHSAWRAPLVADYKGYRVISVAPPSSGGVILLQLLGISENYPLKEWGFHSVQSIHLMIEAERRTFADRAEFLGDPDFVSIPVSKLLNRKYLSDRMKTFSTEKASLSSDINHGTPEGYESEETTHFSVVDPMGNAVSVTTTLNGGFGSMIVVDSAGFLLNNEMDDFSSKPGFPNMYGLVGGEANSIKPSKRILSSMTPTIVEKEGKLFMVLGSPGGSTIPTSVYQVIVNAIDFDMNITDAVGAGRFHHQWLPDETAFERNNLDSLTLEKLRRMGHIFKERSAIGRVNAIMMLRDGTISAGADPRGLNVAAGF